MTSTHDQNNEQVIIALRRVIRAVDLHSRSLARQYGFNSTQALLLKSLQNQPLSAGAISRRLSLSQATVADIMKRLEKRGLIVRNRDTEDRRWVIIDL